MDFLASTVAGKVVDHISSKFSDYIKNFKGQHDDLKLANAIRQELLDRYGNEPFYNDLDSYLAYNKTIDFLILTLRNSSPQPVEGPSEFVNKNLKQFLDRTPSCLAYSSQIKDALLCVFDCTFFAITDMNPYSDCGRLQRGFCVQIAETNSQIQAGFAMLYKEIEATPQYQSHSEKAVTNKEEQHKEYQRLLYFLQKRLKIILQNSGGYYLEKITAQLYPALKGTMSNTTFQIENTEANTSLLNCLNKNWDCTNRSHFMLVGAGGCGKTVAMQQTAQALIDNAIPAIYIPMHALKPEDGCIEKYIQEYILYDDTLLKSFFQLCHDGEMFGKPSLVLFLDGWNEIREERMGQYWFTDAIQEEIEYIWSTLPGIQIVLAGRERADKNIGWNNPLSYLEVMPLQKPQIEVYLNSCNIPSPNKKNPIWQTISNPLMLVLYVNTVGQKERFERIHGIKFISGVKHNAQAAVIWNFLQCQIGKFACLRRKNPYNYFIAINYAASWIGWNMEQEQQYTLTRDELTDLLDKAGENYLLLWFRSSYLTNMRQFFSVADWCWDTEQIRRILCDETFLLYNAIPEEEIDATGGEVYRFIHQKFRDCYAALYMRIQLSPYGSQEVPEACHSWQASAANQEVLDLLDAFFQPEQLDKLWFNQREGVAKDNSFTMFHLLELYRREGRDISQLNFQKQDLRFVSLQNRSLHMDGICFRGAAVSRRTLLPQNHSSTLSFLTWLPTAKGKTTDLFLSAGRDLRLWNVRTGECQQQWKSHDSGITCIAAFWDGSKFATTSHDKKLLIYCTSQLDAPPKCYVAKEDLSAAAFSPISPFLAVGDATGKIFLCSDTGAYLKDVPVDVDFPSAKVKLLRFDDEGQYLSALMANDLLLLWAVSQDLKLQLLWHEKIADKVLDINFGSHGAALLCAVKNGAVFQLKTDNLTFELQWKSEATLWETAAFSCDNKQLAACEEKRLKLLTTFDGNEYKSPIKFSDIPYSRLAFSMDGRKLLCGTEDSSLYVWNAERPTIENSCEEKPICKIKNSNYKLGEFVLLTDHIFLCAFGDGYLTWWDIDNRSCIRCEKLLDVSISHLKLSPDKKMLVIAGNDGSLHFWNVETLCKYNLIKLSDMIRELAFSPDGKIFCCACDNFRVYGWDTTNFQPLFSILLEEKVRILSLAFLRDYTLLAGAANGVIYHWNVPKGTRMDWPVVHKDFVSKLAISTDGKFLASISHDGSIFYWKLECSHYCGCYQLEKGPSFWNCVAISSDGRYVLAGKVVVDGENEIYLWEIRPYENGIKISKECIPLSSMSILQASFFSSDSKISYMTSDGELCIGNVNSLVFEQPLELIPNISLINADFRMAHFEDPDLMELVRMSGGKTEMSDVY